MHHILVISVKLFCENQGVIREDMIEKYQKWFEQDKPDLRSILLSLDKFVQFMNKDHEEIMAGKSTFKRKSPKTIQLYFGFIKSYLRICHGIRLSVEDVQDFIQFPKLRKEPRKPLSLDQLKKIMTYASPRRRALYYVLTSSGMRLGEALTLTRKNLHLEERPVRITLEAENTKTKEGRETYISSEAHEKLKEVLETVRENDLIFGWSGDVANDVSYEDQYFHNLREKLGMTERYPNSVRFVVNIHAMRAFFHTKASQKHGVEYANALDGHGAYLKQYYREDPKERAKKYLDLEPTLLIESVKIAADETKDKMIENLTRQMAKMEAKMKRFELLSQ